MGGCECEILYVGMDGSVCEHEFIDMLFFLVSQYPLKGEGIIKNTEILFVTDVELRRRLLRTTPSL